MNESTNLSTRTGYFLVKSNTIALLTVSFMNTDQNTVNRRIPRFSFQRDCFLMIEEKAIEKMTKRANQAILILWLNSKTIDWSRTLIWASVESCQVQGKTEALAWLAPRGKIFKITDNSGQLVPTLLSKALRKHNKIRVL